jgi:hypothetical protein
MYDRFFAVVAQETVEKYTVRIGTVTLNSVLTQRLILQFLK